MLETNFGMHKVFGSKALLRAVFLSSISIDMNTSVRYSNNVIDGNTLKFLELFQQMMWWYHASCFCFEETDFLFVLIRFVVSSILKTSNSKCSEKHYIGCLGDEYLQQYSFFDYLLPQFHTKTFICSSVCILLLSIHMALRYRHSLKTFRTTLVVPFDILVLDMAS